MIVDTHGRRMQETRSSPKSISKSGVASCDCHCALDCINRDNRKLGLSWATMMMQHTSSTFLGLQERRTGNASMCSRLSDFPCSRLIPDCWNNRNPARAPISPHNNAVHCRKIKVKQRKWRKSMRAQFAWSGITFSDNSSKQNAQQNADPNHQSNTHWHSDNAPATPRRRFCRG